MAKITSITEHFQHFLTDLKESFWGDLEAKTRLAWKQFFEAESERMRNLYAGCETYGAPAGPLEPIATATTRGTS